MSSHPASSSAGASDSGDDAAAQDRIAELEAALRDILEGVGAFTPDGWLAGTDEVVRARAVLGGRKCERGSTVAAEATVRAESASPTSSC